MAWNIKYYAEWNDFAGYRNRLEFLIEGSVEESEEVIVKQFKITYPEFDLFGGKEAMTGGGADIVLISKNKLTLFNKFQSLDYSNPLGIQFRHYIKEYKGQSLYLNFIGYVDTEQIQDQFSDEKNYEFHLTANNGIHVLEYLYMLDSNGNKLTGIFSVFDVLVFCFSKLKINYDSIGIQLATTITGYIYQSQKLLFHYLYINSDNFYDEAGIALTCKEVLTNILMSLSCRLCIDNNNIYIFDIHSWSTTNGMCVLYDFDTLTYQGFSPALFPLAGTSITEGPKPHSAGFHFGKKKVAVSFNKYCYENPISLEVSKNTVSNYTNSIEVTKDGEFYYRDNIFQTNAGFIEPSTDPENVMYVERIKEGNSEFFTRLQTTSVAAPRLRIVVPVFMIHAAGLYIGLTGNIMFEDPAKQEEYQIPGLYYGCPFYYRVSLLDKNSAPIEWYLYTWMGTEIETVDAGKVRWVTSVTSPEEQYSLKAQIVDYTGIKYNKWYNLNGSSHNWASWADPSSENAKKLLTGIIIPLYNPKENSYTYFKGGYVAIDIWVPESGGVNKYKNICLKDLGVALLHSSYNIEGVVSFEKIENTDIIFKGYINELYKAEHSIELVQGCDITGISRAMYILYHPSAAVHNDYYYGATNNFTRATLSSQPLERLLLNTYISNLKENRFTLDCTIIGYHSVYTRFKYNILKRNNTVVSLLPIMMETDYVTSQTTMKLLEVVADSETIQS